MSEVAWVSGWASDISMWEGEIYDSFPDFSHRFVDYFDLLPNPDDFWDKNPRIAAAPIVVGWSMGTLALLRNLHKKPPEQKWLLLCPIADFCAEGCWSRGSVRATEKAVLENPEKTLRDFAVLMGAPPDEGERWLENALRYSPRQLAAGLNYLGNQTFCAQEGELDMETAQNIQLLFGLSDKVVPPAQAEAFPLEFSVKTLDGIGHFLHTLLKQPEKKAIAL